MIVLGTSFPASILLSQRGQLASATAHLQQLQQQDRLLAEQKQQLQSNAEIQRLARQEYQLVSPGQMLFNVLPPAGQAGGATSTGALSGDPGNQPPVAPAQAPNMTPDPGLPAPSGSGSGTAGPSVHPPTSIGGPQGAGLLSRIVKTLEFWK